ncbi:HlyC/CorC family transporter [Haloterrigena sp. SYSU A121-1]|uniref:HlyC/CorC family transporter n=1 Tax=Haloterrigena gelatinilytica TaxID=2741724 RepID=A0A8J8GPM4_9EURY|nr:hemolysin family protein [Haloterrigena gelatinilytica]NUB91667.1 HlyC/CorC family transporter [Haloterrigena gelatinilytica]
MPGLEATAMLADVARPVTVSGAVGFEPSTTLVAAAGVAALLALLVLSGFFSSAEIAMFSLAHHRIEALVEDGAPGAETVQALKDDPHRLLVTILVGNNLVNIAMSSIATGLFAMYTSQGRAMLAATFGVTAVVLLFGESAPKSYAIENTESWALSVARPLKFSEYALLPLVITFDALTRVLNRLTGGTAVEESYVTREEIRELIRTGESEGVIEADEREMLQRVFRFNDTIAKEVLTPRLDVTAVAREANVDEAVAKCVESGHTRLPVYDGDLDTVVGVVALGDLVGGRESPDGGSLEAHVEETLHVPESKQIDELFREMRQQRVEQVVVIDEFGTTEGIVTTEDIVEAVVGEILDTQEAEPIETVDERTVRVDGEVTLEAVNDVTGVEFPEGEEFETIAGFVFNRAGRLVEPGETFAYDGAELTVERVDDTRIRRVRISESDPSAADGSGVVASS